MADRELRLMAVHAHGDDETITMGGTLATYADRGVKTCVVCCTRRQAGDHRRRGHARERHATSPAPRSARPSCVEALRILKVDEVEFLRYGNSGMAGTDTNFSPAPSGWPRSTRQREGSSPQIRRFRPHVVVTYDGNGGYGHPDHIQTHRATLLAVEAARLKPLYKDAGDTLACSEALLHGVSQAEFERIVATAKAAGMDPPFGDADPDEMEFLTPDEDVTTTIDTVDVIGRKRDALRAHQVGSPRTGHS